MASSVSSNKKAMIHVNNLAAQLSSRKSSLIASVNKVIQSGWLVLGPEVENFERSFADYLGIEHCVGVGNGTDAIELALRALGVNRGDSVATVANAGMYTTMALLAIGAKPFYIDVDMESRNTTLEEVERALNAEVKAVVVTHLYGLAVPSIKRIADLCRLRGVPLLEDCAQAHGARVCGKCVGTFGDAASFSFYPTKNLGALGDGGAVVTSFESIAVRVRALRQYGWTQKYQVTFAGGKNSRLDEMQACILTAVLPDLEHCNARRRAIAQRYSEGIRNSLVTTPPVYGEEYVGHLYVVTVSDRASLRAHLANLGISSDVHYPIPDYRQPIFDNHFSGFRLPVTERLSEKICTLPCYPGISDRDVSDVIEAVNSFRVPDREYVNSSRLGDG